MKNLSTLCLRALLAALCLSVAGWGQIDHQPASGAIQKAIMGTRDQAPPQTGFSGLSSPATGNGINYNGGPVMHGTVNIYYIWYGNWGGGSGAHAMTVLQNLASSMGGSPYYNINTTYSDSSGTSVSNSINYGGSTTDNYSLGASLNDAGIQAIVSSAISSGRLPNDTNGVYFVLTSADVNETSGFCIQYCGWHTHGLIAGSDIKYSFVGNGNRCPLSCTAQANSPNADAGVDGMASVISHELEEATSDPDLNAWFDNGGNENADKCAWTFQPTYTASNGSSANMNLGGTDYLIQRNWVNASGGYCSLAYPPPTLTSVNPSSGSVGSTVPVTLTGTGFSIQSTVAVAGTGVTVSNLVVVNSTQITANFNIAANATTGAHNVSVTAAGGTTGAVPFTVNSGPVPTLTSVAPNSGAQATAVNVTLTGTNFAAGATVGVSGTGITVSNVSVTGSTQITATFTIAATAAATSYNVSVTSGGSTSNTVPFTVTGGTVQPTLTTVAPNNGNQGAAVNVTLTGTNFVNGATVGVSGTGVTVSNVAVTSGTQITATFSIAANAAVTTYNVSVTTTGGTSNTVPFTVNTFTPAPTLTSVAPNNGNQGTAVNVTLTGTNFVAGATVGVSGTGITVSNVAVTSGTQITATFTIAANAAAGPYSVSVTTAGGTSNTVPFTVNGASGVPTLTSITPSGGAQGTSVNVTLTGTNFTAGSQVRLQGTGLNQTNIVVVSPTQITATYSISPTVALGPHNTWVVTSAGSSNILQFTVTAPTSAPTLTSVTPNNGIQGTAVNVTLTGTNFASGATVGVSGTGVTSSNVAFVSATQITATLNIAANATTGAYNVSVTSGGSTSNTVPFTVKAATPTLSSVAPNSGAQATAVNVTLTGTNFIAGATVGVSGTGITVSNVAVTSGTQITATFTIAATAAVASYNVSVTTSGGTSNTTPFNVTGGTVQPTLTTVAPNSGNQGAAVNVTLTGTNFVNGATVGVSGTGITVSNVSVTSGTQITATFTIDPAAAAGPYNVSVTTTGGTSNTVPFTVVIPAPTLSSVAPNNGNPGTAVTVTLTGTNFSAGATVGVSGTGITVSNVAVTSGTQITATLTIDPAAAAGAYNVSVTTGGGTSNTVPFTVNSQPPTLSSVAPTNGFSGTAVNVTLTGTNFVSGATVGVSGSGIAVSNVAVTSGIQITATFTIAANAVAGSYNVSVTTTGGTSNTAPFTVVTPAPTLSSVAPNGGNSGSAVNVTLTGTNFIAGATVGVSGTGVTVSNVAVTSGTQITATFTIAANASAGPYNVSVTTSGGTSGTVPFTVVIPAPTLSSVAPNNGNPGGAVNVTLTGTNFMSGATVGVSGNGITVSNVAVNSATQITATFTIDPAAATGAYNVSVTTTGGTSGTVPFTVVIPAPTLSSVAPNNGNPGTAVNVTLTGTNFMSGATVGVSGTGITVSNVAVTSGTQITATFTIASTAASGPYNVSVTTTGGTTNTVPFTVNSVGPTLTSIAPSSGARGTSVNVTLTGTNFLPGSQIRLQGTGLHQTNIVVVSPTQITATYTIDPTVIPGPHNTWVVTSAGSSNILTFTVN